MPRRSRSGVIAGAGALSTRCHSPASCAGDIVASAVSLSSSVAISGCRDRIGRDTIARAPLDAMPLLAQAGKGSTCCVREPAGRRDYPPRQHPDHEWRQLSPQAIRRGPPPRRRRQSGAKPGHRRNRRSRNRRNHHHLIHDEAADMQRAPIGALCISRQRITTGLVLLRHTGLESNRR